MSVPQWKIDRDRREHAEKAKRAEDARIKQAKLDEELGGAAKSGVDSIVDSAFARAQVAPPNSNASVGSATQLTSRAFEQARHRCAKPV